MNDEVWTTKNGQKKILVSDMTEDHAKNALRQCIKRSRERREAKYLEELAEIQFEHLGDGDSI